VVNLALLDLQNKTLVAEWQFEGTEILRIGRSPDNDVVIDNPVVSRQHLELKKIESSGIGSVTATGIDETWQLISHGTNGTFVNGTLVTVTTLNHGALIQLAKNGPLLRFTLEKSPGANAAVTAAAGAKVNSELPLPAPLKVCTHQDNPPNSLFCIHCGEPLHVERTIRNYQILRTLGIGGMGTTYLTVKKVEGLIPSRQLLVLKEMNADMTKILKAQELFEREARVLSSLNHSGIPQFFDFFVEDGKKCLVMEMIHGQDLEKIVFAKGPVVMQQAISWMIQTCEILDYLHNQEPPVVHRDIKPANLMVRTLDRRIVVLDFGAVKEIGTPLGTCIGAPDYTAPEQNRGEPLTQSDLYGVGATLIFLLTGESPQKFVQLKGQGYRFNLDGDPRIPPELRAVIDRATEPKPSDRYQTAVELSQALADCLSTIS
jgi:serine/threonine protein kinase, bacterial